jgi:hypothetical protein
MPGEHVDRRRLARPVRADQPDQLALTHGKVKVVDRDDAAEVLAQAPRFDKHGGVVQHGCPGRRLNFSPSP